MGYQIHRHLTWQKEATEMVVTDKEIEKAFESARVIPEEDDRLLTALAKEGGPGLTVVRDVFRRNIIEPALRELAA